MSEQEEVQRRLDAVQSEEVTPEQDHPLITCEGCGYDYPREDMAALPTKVNLRDGSQREILFCDVVCPDFWDETSPGAWVALHSGEEVQLVNWHCSVCDGVYEYKLVKLLVDTWDFDPDNPLANIPSDEYVVCSSCQKKVKGRFKTREEVGL